MTATTLTAADATAQAHSNQLKQLIIETIRQSDGFISFAHYMQLCLYAPGLGYYSAGSHKLGAGGDFTTAPEISPLFGASLARHVQRILPQLEYKNILEFGAGSGKLAVDLLDQMQRDEITFDHYYIVDTSADLKQRQQQLLAQKHPDLLSKIIWLEQMPAEFEGVIIANEVCDAMPVQLIQFTEEAVVEQGISEIKGEFCWQSRPLPSSLAAKADEIRQHLSATPYLTEINLQAPAWVSTIANSLVRGAVFIIDYGYSFNEYYCADRSQGTLMCFFQQQAHQNPLLLPGLQDITAHVDFTALAEAAVASGLNVSAYQAQADFLMAGDITMLAAELQQQCATESWLQHSAALKQLLLPGQMGERFKVLTLSKALAPLDALQWHDLRHQL